MPDQPEVLPAAAGALPMAHPNEQP